MSVVYSWIDANSKAGEAAYSGNTATIIDYDLGKTMYCIVSVTDQVTSEKVQVESNHVGPINRPVLPDFDTGSIVNSMTTHRLMLALISAVLSFLVRMQPVSNPPLDVTYQWSIRNGTGRLSVMKIRPESFTSHRKLHQLAHKSNARLNQGMQTTMRLLLMSPSSFLKTNAWMPSAHCSIATAQAR